MFKKILHAIVIAVALMVVTAGSAQADSIIYNFVGTGAAISNPFVNAPAIQLAFQVTVSNFINPPFPVGFPPSPLSFVNLTCAQLDSSTNCKPTGTTITFSNQGTGLWTANIQFTASNNIGYVFFFPTGALGATGTYASGNGPNVGTLTITSAAVPEPSSLVLLLAGVLVCGIFRLRLERRP